MTAELNAVPAILRASGLRIASVGTQYAESQRRAAIAALEEKNKDRSDKLCRAWMQNYPATEEFFENRSDLGENTRKYGDQICDSASLYESADAESAAEVDGIEPAGGQTGSGHGGTVSTAGHVGGGTYADSGAAGNDPSVGEVGPTPAEASPAAAPVPANDLYAGLDDDSDESSTAEAGFVERDGDTVEQSEGTDQEEQDDTQRPDDSPARSAVASAMDALDGSLLHAVFGPDVLSEHLASIGTAKAE